MFRRSSIVAFSSKGRTIIRDPRRKNKITPSALVTKREKDDEVQTVHQTKPILPFEPSVRNQQSLGLGSYMLAGVGVAMGVTLVGAILGSLGM